MILAALRSPQKSPGQLAAITRLLTASDLCPLLNNCSPNDLKALSSKSTLYDYRPGDTVSVEGNYIDACYLVLQGVCGVSGGQNLRVTRPGELLGKELILQGAERWRCSVFALNEKDEANLKSATHLRSTVAPSERRLLVCGIPSMAISRYVGFVGPETREVLDAFWKFSRLGKELKSRRSEPLFYDANCDQAQTFSLFQHFSSDIASTKIYQPGECLFSQGEDRTNLFIITQGECSLLRRISQPPCLELDTGLRYFAGDFLFMEGENREWVFSRKDLQLAPSSRGNECIIKGRRAWVWEQHRASLAALTRVEAVVVPLSELAKSFNLFIGLMAQAEQKYGSISSDENLMKRFTQEQIRKAEMKKIVMGIRANTFKR